MNRVFGVLISIGVCVCGAILLAGGNAQASDDCVNARIAELPVQLHNVAQTGQAPDSCGTKSPLHLQTLCPTQLFDEILKKHGKSDFLHLTGSAAKQCKPQTEVPTAAVLEAFLDREPQTSLGAGESWSNLAGCEQYFSTNDVNQQSRALLVTQYYADSLRLRRGIEEATGKIAALDAILGYQTDLVREFAEGCDHPSFPEQHDRCDFKSRCLKINLKKKKTGALQDRAIDEIVTGIDEIKSAELDLDDLREIPESALGQTSKKEAVDALEESIEFAKDNIPWVGGLVSYKKLQNMDPPALRELLLKRAREERAKTKDQIITLGRGLTCLNSTCGCDLKEYEKIISEAPATSLLDPTTSHNANLAHATNTQFARVSCMHEVLQARGQSNAVAASTGIQLASTAVTGGAAAVIKISAKLATVGKTVLAAGTAVNLAVGAAALPGTVGQCVSILDEMKGGLGYSSEREHECSGTLESRIVESNHLKLEFAKCTGLAVLQVASLAGPSAASRLGRKLANHKRIERVRAAIRAEKQKSGGEFKGLTHADEDRIIHAHEVGEGKTGVYSPREIAQKRRKIEEVLKKYFPDDRAARARVARELMEEGTLGEPVRFKQTPAEVAALNRVEPNTQVIMDIVDESGKVVSQVRGRVVANSKGERVFLQESGSLQPQGSKVGRIAVRDKTIYEVSRTRPQPDLNELNTLVSKIETNPGLSKKVDVVFKSRTGQGSVSLAGVDYVGRSGGKLLFRDFSGRTYQVDPQNIQRLGALLDNSVSRNGFLERTIWP